MEPSTNDVSDRDARRLVPKQIRTYGPSVKPHTLAHEVAKDFGVIARDLRSPRTISRHISLARDELCRRMHALGFSITDIARFLGNRERATVCFALERAAKRAEEADLDKSRTPM